MAWDDLTKALADTLYGISGASLTAATVAATDKVLIQDTDDSDSLKTVTAQSIANLATTSGLTANTTVNLTSAMTAAQIQALIDAQPKNLNGYTLTFQFGDGTYTIADTLNFIGFVGGTVFIQGNPSDTTLSTTKSVFLNADGQANGVIYTLNCTAVVIWYLKIEIDSSSGGYYAVFAADGVLTLSGCYILGDSTLTSYGVYTYLSIALVTNTYFSNIQYGISANGGNLFSQNNDDTGTPPLYGLQATSAASIGKDGTQPAGSTANELATTGGVVR
jgi:hypothetical protein